MNDYHILRSKAKLIEIEEGIKENLEKKIKDVKIDEKPFIQFDGKLKYFTTLIDCAISCDAMLNEVNQASNLFVIGFDMEWPFTFKSGSGKTAVIQMSPSLDVCYVFHVSALEKLPKALTDLLAHDKVRLTGVNIKNDIRKLWRDFEGIDIEKVLSNCLDLSTLANCYLDVSRRWSMELLVYKFFDMRINKDKKIRQGKWNIIPLTDEQKEYAALDAHVSLKLFQHMKGLEIDIAEKENRTKAENM